MSTINILQRGEKPPATGNNSAYLVIDRWNDYSFVTMFYLYIFDHKGGLHDIGNVKIGFRGQTIEQSTHSTLTTQFSSLSDEYFSLGEDEEYYKKIYSLPSKIRKNILSALRDIVFDPSIIENIVDEPVFGTSLLRYVSLSSIKGQFKRILNGYPPLTDFNFLFHRDKQSNTSELDLNFKVRAESIPSTNIHAIIGRNGVGKTTILSDMVRAILDEEYSYASFYEVRKHDDNKRIERDYFSGLVSVSFSAFDTFEPPREQSDPSKGTCYFYIGLKSQDDPKNHRTINDLRKDCARALVSCFSNKRKLQRWHNAIAKLGSDENFSSMRLEQLAEKYEEINTNVDSAFDTRFQSYYKVILPLLKRMSSGHAIVLLTITKLVATVEEKTLVLLDEPESHLHPPLLSAFVRALSDLLYDRNGVAVIATHSPVVLQEIPKSCVWKVNRVGSATTPRRPDIETFAENVGVLTREVFGLEVEKSGFHDLLISSVHKGKTYDDIIEEYNGQLGMEGRTLLKTLIVQRDNNDNEVS